MNYVKSACAYTCKIKLAPNAIMPKLATPESAGYDLQTPSDFVIKAKDSCIVDLRIKIQLPSGIYAKIENHSKMTMLKHRIVVAGGIVDNDHDGSLQVVLFNHGKKSRHFKRGDKIAQMILKKYCIVPFSRINEFDFELKYDDTYV
ncbi:dUTPase [Euproctis pseudoconspersa nucleopolyhedrovirus]|uniref:dUTP diphosphatase n=1 Tax=Euproctis pseudoconspersa nucleopolyhedrovirus TaxID=307467 RepID=C3TX03_9ABAC|nr:dUTPase [Euproctis pseudoconspersa nucleopolyhedrovirus]ACO53545.1 dUTPase [Euproctis pseudoconspersa nucleopolyhedrovirus]